MLVFPVENIYNWFNYRLERTRLPEWFVNQYDNYTILKRLCQLQVRQESFNNIVKDQFNDIIESVTELTEQVTDLSASLSDYVLQTELNTALSSYLTETDADAIYVTKTSATATYLAKSVATTTYLKIEDATAQYVTGSAFSAFAGSITSQLANKAEIAAVTAQFAGMQDQIDLKGVPAGGTAGQTLEKASTTDYDTAWV